MNIDAQRALFRRLYDETEDAAMRQVLVERMKRLCRCAALRREAGVAGVRSPGIALPSRFARDEVPRRS